MWNGQIWLKNRAEIWIFQLVNFDYFVVKNDPSLVTFNYYWIIHLQLTIKNIQIWLKFSSWNFNTLISQFWLFCSQKWPFFSRFQLFNYSFSAYY